VSDNPLIVAPAEKVVLIYPGDVALELESLRRQMLEAEAEAHEAKGEAEQAVASAPRRMGIPTQSAGDDPVVLAKQALADAKAEEFDALVESARGRATKITLRGIGGTAFDKLKDEHPPRKDNETDKRLGAHEVDFFRELIRQSIAEPVVTDAQYDEFVVSPGVTKAKWEELRNVAWALSAQDVNLPKFSAASLLRQMREQDSPLPDDTESAPDASTAGSPPNDTSTSTPKGS
jgi:hypothetical protein